MEITKQHSSGFLELKVEGRLDAFWSGHLANELAEVIREGAHHIRLDLAEVTYLSSAGIRVMLQSYKQLRGIQGAFGVSRPSPQVRDVLELAGLDTLLLAQSTAPDSTAAEPLRVRQLEREGARFEVMAGVADASLHCRVIGDPSLLDGCRFGAQDCQTVRFPDSVLAVGLGAFGHDFHDCRNRFGEFLAVAGAAAYLPTDGTNVPDYLVATGTLIPELQVLYALACEGEFAQVAHFEAQPSRGRVSLTELVEASLEIADTQAVCMAVVAESAGLVGAALRHSPALDSGVGAPFAHPEVRRWLSFTTERAYARCLTVVVGVAAQSHLEALDPLLRPLAEGNWPAGHFHAAAFPYRPLRKGEIDLKASVVPLFEGETLYEILHLLGDDREIVGAGQSEFVRGACWIGPIANVVTEGS